MRDMYIDDVARSYNMYTAYFQGWVKGEKSIKGFNDFFFKFSGSKCLIAGFSPTEYVTVKLDKMYF